MMPEYFDYTDFKIMMRSPIEKVMKESHMESKQLSQLMNWPHKKVVDQLCTPAKINPEFFLCAYKALGIDIEFTYNKPREKEYGFVTISSTSGIVPH